MSEKAIQRVSIRREAGESTLRVGVCHGRGAGHVRRMSAALTFSAVLLAAGRSSRMGVDKAMLRMADGALWERQLGVLRAAGCREMMISARPEQTWVPASTLVVHDARPDAGPLAGIAAALAQTDATHLMVLAVDLPRMEPGWLMRLKSHCAPGVGAVGRHAEFFEPLAAIFPRELRGAAESALGSGELSLQRFIGSAGEAMTAVEISPAEAIWFTNWNAPGEAP